MINRSCGCRGEFTVGAKQVRSETPSMLGIEGARRTVTSDDPSGCPRKVQDGGRRKRGRIPVLLAKQM
jgi:hypothetical protein